MMIEKIYESYDDNQYYIDTNKKKLAADNLGVIGIMLTFFISLIALRLFDLIRGERDEATEKYSIWSTVLGTFAVLAIAALSLLIKADYTIFAVITIFLFYVFKDRSQVIRSGAGVAFAALTRTMGYYCTTGLSFIPLMLYNGRKGKGLKWLFYAFYPGHLLVLYMIKLFIQGQ